jgi:hypothetical protein
MFGGQLWDESTYRFRNILNSRENIAALDFMRALFKNFTSRNVNIGSNGAMGASLCLLLLHCLTHSLPHTHTHTHTRTQRRHTYGGILTAQPSFATATVPC